MGQKVNPHGLRVGIIKDWDAKWYAEKDFADNLVEDVKIRKFIKKRLYDAGISKITIERTAGRVKISVYTANPGIVIGKNGASIEALKAELQKMTAQKVAVNIEEVKRPELDAQLVAENIALQLENRAGNGQNNEVRRKGYQDNGKRSSGRRRYRAWRILPRRYNSPSDTES